MSIHNFPTAIPSPKVIGGAKPSGFLHNLDGDHDGIPEINMNGNFDDHKSKENTNMVKLLTATLLPLIVSIVILVRFLHPSGPQFSLTDATFHAFNFSMQHSLLSSQMQVTISSRNPNKRFAISYEDLNVFASYKSQQITFLTFIPATFQGQKITDVWSPYLSGFDVPVAPYFGEELEKNENDGFFFLNVMVFGKVKYKFWPFNSGAHLSVDCPAYFSFARNSLPVTGEVVRFQQMSTCNVDT